MRKLILAVLAVSALALGATGCVSVTAVQGQQGKAFVVKGNPFGSSMWNCEATGGKPKCYKVIKQ